MASFDLAAMVRRSRPGMRRPSIVIRDIAPPAVLATDLFRACYLPIVEAWSRAAEPIMAEYERTLGEMVTDSPADLQREIDGAEAEIQRLLLTLTPRLRDWALRVEGWQRGKWRGAVLSATGVDLTTLIGPEDVRATLEATIERNTGLIKDVSDQARGRIADAVFRGLNERKPAREVAAEVREAVAMSRRRSMNIASHQLSDVTNRLADERRRQAGIDRWMWRHSGKANPRLEHVARNGKVYAETAAAADPPRSLPPPADRPGSLPHCACRSQAVLDLAEEPQVITPAAEPPAERGFVSPINPDVTDETVKVSPRATVQRNLRREFAESARHPAYDPVPEFRHSKPADFGNASLSSAFDDETASMIAAIKPELDNLADQIGIPRLRGFKTVTGRSAMASQGDGLMYINPSYFNGFADRVGGRVAGGKIAEIDARRAALADQMKPIAERIRALQAELGDLEGGMRNPRWVTLYDEQRDLSREWAKLREKDDKLWRQKSALRTASGDDAGPSTWKPGDDEASRPFNNVSYFEGMDRARNTMFHEFGHHVHQYLRREGLRRMHGKPPLERDLQPLFRRAMAERKATQASKYATTNELEWFAENFALFVMGRNNLVDPELLKVFKAIFDGTY